MITLEADVKDTASVRYDSALKGHPYIESAKWVKLRLGYWFLRPVFLRIAC